jgi:type IV pilus assembly protein PilB
MQPTRKNSPSPKRRKKLGECLIDSGLIDAKTLANALKLQKMEKKKIGQILIEMGVADDVEIARALSGQLKIPYIDLKQVHIPADTIALVPPSLAENYLLLPVRQYDHRLLVAMTNPLDFYALDDLRFVTGMPVEIGVASYREVLTALAQYYPKLDLERDMLNVPGLDDGIEVIKPVDADEEDVIALMKLTELPPVVRFSNAILADAIKLKASDIHIEPRKTAVILRYRIDGILREIMNTDKHVHASLVSRIKIISNMDITVRRKPQDGRAQIRHNGRSYDLRVSTIPTSYGEKVTIRILNPERAKMALEDMGFSARAYQDFAGALDVPQGMILVTGPTGSGKSSTLYACLNRLNSPQVNIVTVEDPVEYDIAGINQVQINPKAGITFAAGLRSILRQDPDIVMVGEIRDAETAAIAFQAAQTGHLVLSTLHTNDAASAVTRLLDLGVDAFLISASLLAVVGQRLVRQICPKCKVPDPLSPQLLKRLPAQLADKMGNNFWKGSGCETCQYTGYSGRIGIFEMLMATPALKETIEPHVSAEVLKKIAQDQGFQAMSLDGLHKATKGLTTIEEVLRVAPPELEEHLYEPVVDTRLNEDVPAETPQPDKPATSVGSTRTRKVLVADDNEMILKVLSNLLESENYAVLTAKNGVEAMKLAFREKPDLIITDYLMPQMNGIELIKKLKSQLSTRYIPIIMLTGKKEIDTEVAVINAGADDYMTKPVNPKTLMARLNRLTNRPGIAD